MLPQAMKELQIFSLFILLFTEGIAKLLAAANRTCCAGFGNRCQNRTSLKTHGKS